MANVKLDMNIPMLNLSGEAFTSGDTQGKMLANQLATTRQGDAMKYYAWAMDLWAGKPLEVDQADLTTLIKFVKDDPETVVLVKAQLIKTLESVKK